MQIHATGVYRAVHVRAQSVGNRPVTQRRARINRSNRGNGRRRHRGAGSKRAELVALRNAATRAHHVIQ